MLKAGRSLIALMAALLTLALSGTASAAVTWTPVSSGTTADITAIDYHSGSRAWFATADGRIFYADGGGSFRQAAGTLAGASYTDIAFRPRGDVGVAVTLTDVAQISRDGGATWTEIPLLVSPRQACRSELPSTLDRLYGAFWAGDDTVYLVGGGGRAQPIILRLPDPFTFPTEVNWISAVDGCRVGDITDAITDGFALPGAPRSLRFITDDFGEVYATADALATPSNFLLDLVVGAGGVPRIAVDPANPNNMWAANQSGLTYADSGLNRRPVVRADTTFPVTTPLHDIAYSGGTLLSAGDGGAIYTSRDGKVAHLQRAGGAHATTNWRAVGLASANAALVGGAGGALVKSTNASALPAPPPRVDAPPPSPGRPARRGGSTPPNASGRALTRATGGARLTLWKRIALSRGRYVPVRVSARSPRRFVIEIRRAVRPRRRVALAKARLRRGSKLVRVPLRRSVRTGRYRIVVRVFKGRRQIGRRITVAFILAR